MKLLFPANILLGAALLAGCISQQRGLVLDPIGPPTSQSAGASSNGTLMVFSAFDPHAHFNDLPYLHHYTDYKITFRDGKLLQTVHNDNGTLLEEPKRVQLPVGSYCVFARANGYRVVTVPVIIRAGQITTVHLEGSPSWQNRSELSQSNPVRLPGGEIAGWRAEMQRAGQTASPAPARWHHEVISEFNDGETKFWQLVPDKNP
jgi:hypothetical protein